MPAVVRVGDKHDCGSVATQGSPNVLANGIPIHRVTDEDNVGCHTSTQRDGSPNVFANGLPIARIGDNHNGDACPHAPNPHVTGSPNVFANGT